MAPRTLTAGLVARVTAILAVALGACGGGAGAGPVSMADAEAGCRSVCQRNLTCGAFLEIEQCTATCVADTTGVIRDDVFADTSTCLADLPCGADEQICRTCQPTAAHQAYETTCRARYADCATPGQIDSLCSVTPVPASSVGALCSLATPIIEEMTGCLDDGTTCAAATTCLQNVLRAYGIAG